LFFGSFSFVSSRSALGYLIFFFVLFIHLLSACFVLVLSRFGGPFVVSVALVFVSIGRSACGDCIRQPTFILFHFIWSSFVVYGFCLQFSSSDLVLVGCLPVVAAFMGLSVHAFVAVYRTSLSLSHSPFLISFILSSAVLVACADSLTTLLR